MSAQNTTTIAAPPSGDASTRLREAADRTLASSATVSITNLLSFDGQPRSIKMVGAFDFSTSRGSLIVRLPGAAGGNRELHELFTPGTIFVRGAADTGLNIPGNRWGALPRLLAEPHYLFRTGGNDPVPLIREIAELADPVNVGLAQVNGVTTTHVVGTPTEATVMKYAGSNLRAQLSGHFGQLKINEEAWITTQGLLSRIAFDLSVAGSSGGPLSQLQLDLTNYGSPVTFTVPSPDQTVPVKAPTGILFG